MTEKKKKKTKKMVMERNEVTVTRSSIFKQQKIPDIETDETKATLEWKQETNGAQSSWGLW